MDEGAADSAVTVDEWMDRLELSVGQRRLDDRRDILPPQECHEILQELRHLVLGRGYELGVARRCGTGTQPVLNLSDVAGETPLARQDHEGIVDDQDVRDRHRSLLDREFHRPLHGGDIRDHAPRRVVALVAAGEGPGDAPLAHLQTLDSAGRESLGSEKLPADRLEAAKRRAGLQFANGNRGGFHFRHCRTGESSVRVANSGPARRPGT